MPDVLTEWLHGINGKPSVASVEAQWGKKWRRDQYSIDAVKALAATFLALDGPYMMFTGGEE